MPPLLFAVSEAPPTGSTGRRRWRRTSRRRQGPRVFSAVDPESVVAHMACGGFGIAIPRRLDFRRDDESGLGEPPSADGSIRFAH